MVEENGGQVLQMSMLGRWARKLFQVEVAGYDMLVYLMVVMSGIYVW